jgi:hypothetical protein
MMRMNLQHFLPKPKDAYSAEDIHTYIQDLDRLIFLRDKAEDTIEQDRLTESIEVMNEVLTFMLQKNLGTKGTL